MKRTIYVAVVLSLAAFTLLSTSAQAQKVDVAFGVSAMDAPGASACGNDCIVDHAPQSLTGGAYPGISGDVQAFHHIGIGAEFYWRASQGENYAGQGFNYRPVFWNANAVYSPRIIPHVYAEIVGGIGGLNTRYYTGENCGFYTCSDYTSSNHFDGDFGGGIKFYPKGGFFIRPEARVYIINNNTDFSSNHATRYGVSIGYTFGQH